MKTKFIITGLIMLIVANLLMAYSFNNIASIDGEGFMNYVANAANTGKNYIPMGEYDGIEIKPENGISSWRNTAPNEPLEGDGKEFQVGPDALFMFKNNQCKPGCCGASFSCAGGCVCSTAAQRQMIATRGGNRTVDE
jgi:hypothetical protein